MAQEKLSYEQFKEAVDPGNQAYLQDLHNYLLDNGCKATFEEKKTGLLGSYKHTKTKKSVVNLLQKKQGLLVRIYGENTGQYADFLNTLPEEMVQAINKAGECKRITQNTCSTKCIGYDVTIRGERYQKCKYNAFEFLVTDGSSAAVRSFVENEINGRTV